MRTEERRTEERRKERDKKKKVEEKSEMKGGPGEGERRSRKGRERE